MEERKIQRANHRDFRLCGGSAILCFRTTPPYLCPSADYSGDGVVRNKELNSHVTASFTRPDVQEMCSQDKGTMSRYAEHKMMWKSHVDKSFKSHL